MNKKIIVIVGPTGSGKTDLAIELAQQFSGEIICVDSRTIYRGMDIGTAKPTKLQQQIIPHHGLDLIKPGQRFNVAQFKSFAQKTIKQIWERGNIPILVGGSGLYIDAILFDYSFRSPISDEDFSQLTDIELHKLVQERFPQVVTTLDFKNRRRLEQLLARGPATTADRSSLKYNCLIIGLNQKKTLLKQKIEQRADHIMSTKFTHEVKKLSKMYGPGCPQLKIFAYHRMADYLTHQTTLKEAKQLFIHDDLAFARRQITWFKRNPHIQWIQRPEAAFTLVKNFLE